MTNTSNSLLTAALFTISMTFVGAVNAQTIKADHTTVDASTLSSSSLDAARNLRMNFSHASVGGNIWDGLTRLASNSKYAFPKWTENNRGNPGWAAKVSDFETWVAAHASEFDVFQNKLCYIDQDANFATYRDSMLALKEKYPSKVFVWWTMPIMTEGSENSMRAAFNKQVRDYCKAHDLPLYDIADIESHKTDGSAVTSGGVEALDPAQSNDGGHLTESGASRAAQAQWALMAQIAAKATGTVNTGTGGGSGTGSTSGSGGTDGSEPTKAAEGGEDSGCSITTQRGGSSLALALAAACGLLVAWRRRKSR